MNKKKIDNHNDYIYSIVIPVYQSESTIYKVAQEVLGVIEEYSISAEAVFIDDGSTDKSWDIISNLALQNKNIKAIKLLKNYGQHNAVICGFINTNSEFVITMDDDLQNPPSEIIKLIEGERDNDLVFGNFKEKMHSLYRRVGSKMIGYLNYKIFNKPKELKITNFRLIRRDLIERVLEYNTSYPYIPGLLLMYAKNISSVEVKHNKRVNGKSNYTTKRIISLVSSLLINYSSYPLRLIGSIGILISIASFVIGLYYLLNGILYGSGVQGWTTIVVLVSLLGGFIIILLSVIGEYLSRVLSHLSGKKIFHIEKIVE
ncbi:glycosyltransferase family 2 protein [bacterium]|jgi:polyisoprenyl-phosphate glycosyltransferase|nr:glycosyltransferase family 2 protein [bacterium]